MEIRPLRLDDDLIRVADLIYETDKYIYPYLFKDKSLLYKVAINFIKRETIFNYKNIIVCLIDGKIVGFITHLDKFPKNNYSEMVKAYEDSNVETNADFEKVNKEYFEELNTDFFGKQLVSVCVLKEAQGRKVAQKMIEYFGNIDMSLAAVKDNKVAIHVYEKMGFKILYDYLGFINVPCVEMKREAKEYGNDF